MGESTDGIVLKHLQTLYSAGAIGGLSDGQLGDRVLAGRDDTAEAAFTVLAERHGPMVLRICRQMLNDRHEAEDAFQATFLVLASKAHAIRNRDSVAGWLHGVARRVALRAKADAARRQIKERRAATLAVAHSPVDTDGSQGESWPELHEEIARLPERYREPIVLCYLEGLTTEAASQRLGCPQGTVLSRLSRAKERLRRSLTRRGVVVPAGLLAAEWGSEVALAMPAALLETTVRASLNFTARQVAGAALASNTAVGLARGVLYAMTLSQWKTIGAATLACVLATGGLRAFAQFGGLGAADEAATVKPVANDRQAALTRSVAKLQAELDEATRRNTELQKRLQAIQAELKTLQPAQVQAPAQEANQVEEPVASQPNVQAEGTAPYNYINLGKMIFVASPAGDKVKFYNTETKKSRSLELLGSKEFPLEITPIEGPGVAALLLKGPKIRRIAATLSVNGPWYIQDLREPVNGTASPMVEPSSVVYVLGRYIYAFSPEARRWGVVEFPKGVVPSLTPTPRSTPRGQGGRNLAAEGGGHIYTFDFTTGEWNDIDIRAILDAPEDKDPFGAEPPPPRSRRVPRPELNPLDRLPSQETPAPGSSASDSQ